MSYEPGTHIDLTYLNEKPKKRGVFSVQFEDEESTSWYEPGVRIVFLHA